MTFTKLVITIDTEEDIPIFGHHSINPKLENIKAIPRFQELCNMYDIKPTYLIDYPVAKHKQSVKILKDILREKRCEIGAHLHPWNTPPIDDIDYSNKKKRLLHPNFLSNLPSELQFKKLKILTNSIKRSFGIYPTSFRAGRFGFNEITLKHLEKLNYKVDTSVTPLFFHKSYGKGPDFRYAPLNPYHPSKENICKKGSSKILEVPISAVFSGLLKNIMKKIYFSTNFWKIHGIYRRLHLINRIKVVPSSEPKKELLTACKILIKKKVPIINIMFHSSELMIGKSPYVNSQKELKEYYEKIEAIFKFIKKNNIESKILTEFAEEFDNK